MSSMFQNASGVVTTDRVLPPQQRKEIAQNLRFFAEDNPKLAAFLGAQAALAGLPLILFLAFATTTLLVSLITCLLLGILAALAFTFVVVGFALIFVVPTVFIASCSATFIFIWALVGYTILRRLNGGEAPSKRGTRMGDKLHGLTVDKTGLRIGGAADQTQVEKNEGKDSTKKSGAEGGEDRYNGSRQGIGGDVNGVDDHHATLEWERKWDSEVQQQPVVPEVENPYEVLKTETEIS